MLDLNKDSGYFVVDGNAKINMSDIPLSALRRPTKVTLCMMLNGIKYLLSEEGYLRDWRGLCDFAGIKPEQASLLSNHRNPMEEILDEWVKSDVCSLGQFQQYLAIIDRWDVIADTNQQFLEDAENYINLKEKNQLVVKLPENSTEIENGYSERLLLTGDDVKLAEQGLPPQQYSGFVLYADEDVEFATELIERMENYGLKMCDKSRDLLGGTMSHDAILRLIAERCNRLIVIVSPAFLRSVANNFFMSYAQSIGIKQDRRKIVPCLYKDCILPPQLSFYFVLRYEQSGKLYNFWEKLRESVKSTVTYKTQMPIGVLNPKITITDSDTRALDQKIMIDEPMKKVFYPPAPKMRSASSMLNLSAQTASDQSKPMTEQAKLNGSNSFLNKVSLNDKLKSKSFWDLSASSKSKVNGVEYSPSATSLTTTKKKKWYKFMVPKSTGDVDKKLSEPGTPTSTRSLDPAVFLPSTDSNKPVKKEKKWYKRKLLA